MVSVNVSQLLLSSLGTVRDFDFAEPLPDAADELHLRGPIHGHARLTRTHDGVLVHTEYDVPVTLECARCLEETQNHISGTLDEEFFPTIDLRTGTPADVPPLEADDQLLIDEHHEIDLDEVLRQNILTNLPLRPLCSAECPGLCPSCGQRLDTTHRQHPEIEEQLEPEAPVDAASPFARLAVLLKNDQEG
ncbi:MAG TPA: YceD family protein [Chloroflexota bacterium]|jgi:uncharacterized protein|nr:YceD family protein [Chloroflexota bacterium]